MPMARALIALLLLLAAFWFSLNWRGGPHGIWREPFGLSPRPPGLPPTGPRQPPLPVAQPSQPAAASERIAPRTGNLFGGPIHGLSRDAAAVATATNSSSPSTSSSADHLHAYVARCVA